MAPFLLQHGGDIRIENRDRGGRRQTKFTIFSKPNLHCMLINDNLHYGAKPITFANAKLLRQRITPAEKVLWYFLRNSKTGYKFRRQHPINIFIADFYCHEKKVVIEIDGEIHNSRKQKEYDRGRAIEIEKFDIIILRYTNNEVINFPEAVVEDILKALSGR